MKEENQSPSLFIKCLAISALLHTFLLIFFFSYPLLFSPLVSSWVKERNSVQTKKGEKALLEEEIFLKESLNDLLVLPSESHSFPLQERLSSPPFSFEETTLPFRDPFSLVVSNSPAIPSLPLVSPHFFFQEEQSCVQEPLLPLTFAYTPSPCDKRELPSKTLSFPRKEKVDLPLNIGSEEIPFSLPLMQLALQSYPPSQGALQKNLISPISPTLLPLDVKEEAPLSLGSIPFHQTTVAEKSLERISISPTPEYLVFKPAYLEPMETYLPPTLSQAIDPTEIGHFSTSPPSSLSALPSTFSFSQEEENPFSYYEISSLNSIDWNDLFDIEIKTSPRSTGGYLFSLTLIPKKDLSSYQMKQHYYFLLDRSNTIEKHRFQTFKRGVIRALSFLQEGDKFNIIVFDKKISRLNQQPLLYNKKSQKMAEAFLEKESQGHFGSSADIYASLAHLIPHPLNPDAAHTMILLSDGDPKKGTEKQRESLNHWIENNRGRIALYTATVGQGNDLITLDLLGTVSRGKLLYSDTHTGFPRKLAKLVLNLRTSVAKELSFSISAKDPQANIELFPSSYRLPYLMGNRPYTLIGTANKLTNFSLILQGKNRDSFLSIKKEILFDQTKQGGRLLLKEWNVEQAHHLYEQYLRNGTFSSLEEAKTLLDHGTYLRG